MPIYVGYWRGALRFDSLAERVRGWLYFLFGIWIYMFVLCSEHFPKLPFYGHFLIIGATGFTLGLAYRKIAESVVNRVSEIFGKVTFGTEEMKSFRDTVLSAILFGSASALFATFPSSFFPLEATQDLIPFGLSIASPILLAFVGCLSEIEARNYLKRNREI